jgi:mannitol-specific phosphotransferase system IIBC component
MGVRDAVKSVIIGCAIVSLIGWNVLLQFKYKEHDRKFETQNDNLEKFDGKLKAHDSKIESHDGNFKTQEHLIQVRLCSFVEYR